jgi:hypothetical protein
MDPPEFRLKSSKRLAIHQQRYSYAHDADATVRRAPSKWLNAGGQRAKSATLRRGLE